MKYQIIPFIGGPLNGGNYWADLDNPVFQVQHSSEHSARHAYQEPRYFPYHIVEKNGHHVAVCSRECSCMECHAKRMKNKELTNIIAQ